MKQNKKCRICLWLDQNLIEIFTSKNFELNEELESFFQYQNQKSNITTEITLDSYPEIQNIISFFHDFNLQIDNLMKNISSFKNIILDIGTEVFYDDYVDDDTDNDQNECERLAAYYNAFYKRPEEQEKIRKENELHASVHQYACENKIQQIKNFYNLNNIELNNNNSKQLIKYLIKHIDNNKDIVKILNYKGLKNQSGKLYTKPYIAKQRYLIKKYG